MSSHETEAIHFGVKGYATGFLLSVVLTAIPFWLVMDHVLASPRDTAFTILGFAAVQMVVHMVYFLHLNAKVEGGWSLLALVFTGTLVVIVLAGSTWVMFHLDSNMMPTRDAVQMRGMT